MKSWGDIIATLAAMGAVGIANHYLDTTALVVGFSIGMAQGLAFYAIRISRKRSAKA